jgi:multiple sugar transport system substrate-binding protein
MHANNLSRRRFLRNSALLGSGALLAACTAMPAPAAPADADMAEAPVEIEFTVWGSWDQIYGLLMDHLYADTNIVLEIGSAPFGQYHDRLLTRFASGDLPDIAMLVDFDFARFQNRGFLTDLTSYVEDHPDWDINAPGYNHFYPVITDFFKSEGKPFAIPAEVNPMGIGFNIDMFEEAGIPTPHEQWQAGTWTWDAFVETALEMKRGEGDETIYGWTGGPARIWNISNRIWQNGGDVFNEDKTQVVVNEPAGHEAIQWMFDLYLVHELGPANLRSPDAGAGGLFQQGRLAMRDVGTWTRKGLEESDINWGVAPQPKSVKHASWTGGFSYAIPKGSEIPDEAWSVIKDTASLESAKFLLENGGAGSSVVAAMESESFVFEPPKHAEAFLDMLASAHPQPFIRRNQEFLEIWDREMDLVAIGEKSAEEAAVQIKTETEPLLEA